MTHSTPPRGRGGDDPDDAGQVDWAPILAFLPRFQSPGFTAGTRRGGAAAEDGVLQLPWVELSGDLRRFVATLYGQGAIVVFDWASWAHSTGARLADDPGALARADIDDLRRLLTAIVRQDRFSEGSLLGAFDSGLIVRILERVAELVAKEGG